MRFVTNYQVYAKYKVRKETLYKRMRATANEIKNYAWHKAFTEPLDEECVQLMHEFVDELARDSHIWQAYREAKEALAQEE